MLQGIDVLLPYYNGGQFVRAQLSSILNQTTGDLRLTVLDNGSDAAHSAELQDAVAGATRIRVIKTEDKCGVIGSVERLLKAVEAPYFALADQDDVWDPDKLEISLAALGREDVDLVYTDLRMVDEHGKEFFPSKWRYSNTPPLSGHCALQLVLKNPVAGCTIVARKEVLARALPFPRGIPMHDRWLAIVAALGRGVGYVDRTTVSYRQHAANDTGGLAFGFGPLRQRILRSGGSFRSYSQRRRESRKVLLQYIARHSKRGLERFAAGLMGRYLELGTVGTLLGSLPYAALVSLVGGSVGLKNIGSDVALSIAAGLLAPKSAIRH